MLQNYTIRSLCSQSFTSQLTFLQNVRAYSPRSREGDDDKELDAARQWFAKFTKNTIPESSSSTEFVKSSGPGGQKTNKTSSKAQTTWKISALEKHVPSVLISELRSSRYYNKSSDQIAISCDSHRNRTENKSETHRRLEEEIKTLYKKRVPGITSPEQQKKVESLKAAENSLRLKFKKQHGDKKRARSGGGKF